jgi:hypothetical protein
MTKDDIIDMAQEAGFVEYELDDGTTNAFDIRYQRFYNLAVAAEREACAAMFDDRNVWDEEVGERIRARGNA